MKPLTKKQKELLDNIEAYFAEHGYMPTYDELSQIVGGVSTNSIWAMVAELIEKGWLEKEKGKHRGFVIVERKHD